MRRITSTSAADAPICAWSGITPIANVATPIITTEMISAGLRPILSPMSPKTTPPTGRAAKPMAKTPKAASREATGSVAGKKSVPMMGAR